MRKFLTVALTFVVALTAVPGIKAEAAVYIPNANYDFEPYHFEAESTAADEDTYNVLAIGNSITFHPACQYWWGNWGMASSSRDKDYVHQVVAGLEDKYDNVALDVVSFSLWERTGIRNTILPNIESILTDGYDLVIIQLGENSHDLSAFESEYETLVQTVKAYNPEAQVVLVGDYWKTKGRDAMKKNVAERQGCAYIDISDIRDKAKYRSVVGEKVLGDDGQVHEIDFSAVAAHPNDNGMAVIAERILASLK